MNNAFPTLTVVTATVTVISIQVQTDFHKYSNVLKLQRGYDEAYKNPGKYAITGGAKRSRDDSYQKSEQAHLQSIMQMTDFNLAKTYRLGFVGKYNW